MEPGTNPETGKGGGKAAIALAEGRVPPTRIRMARSASSDRRTPATLPNRMKTNPRAISAPSGEVTVNSTPFAGDMRSVW